MRRAPWPLSCPAMPRSLALLLITFALALAACGSESEEAPPGGEPAASTAAPTKPEPPAAADASCAKKEEASGDRAQPCPTPTLIEGKANVVTFETSEGSFEVTLDTERAPITSNSLAYLTKKKFYDGLVFHRVVPKFVIQGGDPLGDTPNAGTGGPGYSVTEAPPADLKYTRGVVAMAKGGADAPACVGQVARRRLGLAVLRRLRGRRRPPARVRARREGHQGPVGRRQDHRARRG